MASFRAIRFRRMKGWNRRVQKNASLWARLGNECRGSVMCVAALQSTWREPGDMLTEGVRGLAPTALTPRAHAQLMSYAHGLAGLERLTLK